MELRLPLEMSPGREAACRAVFGTWPCFYIFGLVWCLFDCFRALGNLSSELLARPVRYMPRDAGDQQTQKTCLGTRPTQRKAELTTRERGSRGGEREKEARL